MSQNTIRKNIFYSVSLSLLNLVVPAITVPYISRVLGVANVGLANFTITYAGYFVIFAAIGINIHGVREIAKHRHDQAACSRIFSELFRITLISTLALTTIYLASIFAIEELRRDWKLFAVAGMYLYATPVSIYWYFQGTEDFRVVALQGLVSKILSVVALFIFVKHRDDILPYVLISSIAIIGPHIWSFTYALRRGLRVSFGGLSVRRHLKPMFIILGSNAAASIFGMLDVIILGFLSTHEEIGYFTTANKVVMLIVLAFVAINAALIPRLSANYHKNDHKANDQLLQKAFDLTVMLIVPAAIGLCLVSPRFVPFFLGGEFSGSILPMQILSFKVFLAMINSFFSLNVLMAMGFEIKFLTVLIITAVFSLTANLLLIPVLGAVGAAATSVAAEAVQMALNLLFVYKFTRVRLSWRQAGVALLYSSLIVALYFVCNGVIENNVVFLCVFMTFASAAYFSAQFFVARNQLLAQLADSLTGRIKI